MDKKRKRALQVVLTREEKASVSMSTKLRELGFKPIIFPTIQFVRVYSDYTGPQNFSGTGWLIFSTKRSVQYFFKRFRQKIDPAVKMFAIGNGTASELQKNKYEPEIVAESSSLVDLSIAFEKIKPCKVVYLCSKSNVGSLNSILGPRGFVIKELPLYTTEPPAEIDESKLEIIKKGYYDIITFASSSSIRHLMIILKGKVGVFKGKVAIVLGSEAEKLLAGSSFDKVIATKSPNEESLVQTLVEYRNSLE